MAGFGRENREDVSNRFLSSAFQANSSTDTTLSRMLGKNVPEQRRFCCECGNEINGPAYPDPKNPEQVYCEKHYEKFASKCSGCGRPIIGVFAKAVDGSKWHQTCINQDFPCERCHKPIFSESDCVQAINGKWHIGCWTCSRCNLKIGRKEGEYLAHNGDPYCLSCGNEPNFHRSIPLKPDPAIKQKLDSQRKQQEQDIYNNIQQGKVACAVCSQIISQHEAIKFNDKLYHDYCFTCSSCGEVINTDEGIARRGDKAVCVKCSKQTVVCVGCHKPLSGTYLNGPNGKFHADCFKCDICHQKLTMGFVEKNGKTVCPTCGKNPSSQVSSTTTTTQKAGGFTIDPRTGQKKYI